MGKIKPPFLRFWCKIMVKLILAVVAILFLYNIKPLFYAVCVLFGIYAVKRILLMFPTKYPPFILDDSALDIYFGAPGSGKTTLAAYYAARALAVGIPVYSNVPIKGCYKLTKDDIGKYLIENALVIFDEAGVEYNSRQYKTNFSSVQQIEWYKKHRHEGCQVIIFSQGFDDADKILRNLSTRLYVVRKGLFNTRRGWRKNLNTITYRAIDKVPDIDEMTHQPIDYYGYTRFSKRRIFCRPVWHMFDTRDRMGLPPKPAWELYE